MKRFGIVALLAFSRLVGEAALAADAPQFLTYVRQSAAALRADDQPPSTLAAWQKQRATVREGLKAAWGGWPAEKCALEPKVVGTLDRPDYRVEKILFQTRPGLWATTNAYVPKREGKLPAVLCVHGHWAGAKQDPVVQARCIGLAKLGFFVLVIDALGAGERGIGEKLGEYHGEMTGATLFPIGLPLSGLQVYDNMRAIDYLLTRPEVDGARLGITGASGGGNQSMYAGTYEERFKAAVPVCSVGNYQAYLGAACCMCEVVPGALRFTEEGGVLGLAASRALMVISATQDARQFSVDEAKKSIAYAGPIFALNERPGDLKHTIIESPHHYNQPMREAMYGWMTKHLKGEGTGSPIAEPEIKTEEPETLRCFPGDSRPDDFLTIPQFAAAEARRLEAARTTPKTLADWKQAAPNRRAILTRLLGLKARTEQPSAGRVTGANGKFVLRPDTGLELPMTVERGSSKSKVVVVLDLGGTDVASKSGIADEARRRGWNVVTLDLRATGSVAIPNDKVGNAPDHNSAEWSLWLGFPLLGQWVDDIRCVVDGLEHEFSSQAEITVIGNGPAGLVALTAAALDERIKRVATVGTMATYVTATPYRGQRLGTLVPGLLRDFGDVADVAALSLPRRVVMAGATSPTAQPLSDEAQQTTLAATIRTAALLNSPTALRLSKAVPQDVLDALDAE